MAFWTAVQESVLVLLLDVLALKNPNAQVSHIGWVVLEPAIMVYLPGGHLLCAAQPRLGQPGGQTCKPLILHIQYKEEACVYRALLAGLFLTSMPKPNVNLKANKRG